MESNKTIPCPFLEKVQLLFLPLCTPLLKCQIIRIAFSGTRPQQNKPLSFLLQLWIVVKLKYSYKFAQQKVMMACYCSSKGGCVSFFNYLIIMTGWKKGKKIIVNARLNYISAEYNLNTAEDSIVLRRDAEEIFCPIHFLKEITIQALLRTLPLKLKLK